jgi:hypothetical protein
VQVGALATKMENKHAERTEWLQLDRERFELEKKKQEAQHQLLLTFAAQLKDNPKK